MIARTLAQPADAGLLNRYLLPKVALAVIAIASLAGTHLTMRTHGATPAQTLVRWLHLVAIGTLAGGTMWWALFLRRPATAEERAELAAFAVAQQERFRTVAAAALLAAVLTAPHLVQMGVLAIRAEAAPFWLANVLSLGAALLATIWALARAPSAERAFQGNLARASWIALIATLASTAALDARLTFPAGPAAWLLRPIHLVAFGLWIGGAIWNIVVAVPGAQQTLTFAVVVAAAQQLERFRRAVRVILPTLLLTGLLQALPYTGLDATTLFLSPVGRLILLKLGLIVALVAIFITCPLWRACSPIRGICDLEDLKRPTVPQPALRLDNRGQSCAGFVHIRRALDALQAGAVLELLSSDPISWWELPAWLDRQGHILEHRERGGRLWWRTYRYLIRKSGAGPEPAAGD